MEISYRFEFSDLSPWLDFCPLPSHCSCISAETSRLSPSFFLVFAYQVLVTGATPELPTIKCCLCCFSRGASGSSPGSATRSHQHLRSWWFLLLWHWQQDWPIFLAPHFSFHLALPAL